MINKVKIIDEIEEASADTFKVLFESSIDCLKVITPDGLLYKMNDNGKEIMEVEDFSSIKGADWLSFWEGEDHYNAIEEFRKALDGRSGRFQGFCNTVKGSPRWWDVVLTPILSNFKIVAILSSSRDITEQVHLQKQLEEARLEAVEANKNKSLFIANMSHEIRNPLTIINGFAQILAKNNSDSKKVSRFSEKIVSNGERVLKLMNELLDLSKLESGKIDIIKSDFNIATVISDLVESTKVLVKDKDINIKFRSDIENDDVYSDPFRIQQVITNLLSNSIKFTEKGDITLLLSREGKKVFIDVIDQGSGIPSDKHSLIFEPYRQASKDTDRSHGGTGLGLSLSKKLMQLLGGDLELVSSNTNSGSHFRLYF